MFNRILAALRNKVMDFVGQSTTPTSYVRRSHCMTLYLNTEHTATLYEHSTETDTLYITTSKSYEVTDGCE